MSEFKVRLGDESDLDELANSATFMMAEAEGIDIDRDAVRLGVAHVLKDPSRGFYVVMETNGGKFAGSLFVNSLWMDLWCGYTWWIHCVHVRKQFRGRNAYKEMYEFVRSHAKEKADVTRIRLYVDRDNSAARKVYERTGMAEMSYVIYQEKLST
jgi:ribosomal protein S18 acetylase RimI-like enzyme